MDVKWLQVSNADDTATLKQHAYIHKVCKVRHTGETYDGNISLCGRSSVVNENELRVSMDELNKEESAPLNESKVRSH